MIIVGFELRRMFFGPRGVLTFLAIGVSFLAIIPIHELMEELIALKADPMGQDPLSPAYGFISEWTELPREQIVALFESYPPQLIAYFAALLGVVPILVYICGYDQTASDMGRRHFRYLLLRVDRVSLLLGRALAVLVLLGFIYALAAAALVAVLSTMEGAIDAVGLLYLLRIWLCALVFTLPLVALLAWTNALTASPRVALAMAIAFQLALTFIGWQWDEVTLLKDAPMLFPTAFKYHLLSDDFGFLQVALAHQVGLTLLFSALAWVAFRRKDI